MILDQFKSDNHDKVTLIGAMCVSNELDGRVPEGEISRVKVGNVGDFYPAAMYALKLIAKMHRQDPADWDGVVWYERFADASEGSLADRLVDMLVSSDPTKEEVRSIVIDWLKESDL